MKQPRTMKTVQADILSKVEAVKSLPPWHRLFKSDTYKQKLHDLEIAVLTGSQWVEHGRGNAKDRASLLQTQRTAEAYYLKLTTNHE